MKRLVLVGLLLGAALGMLVNVTTATTHKASATAPAPMTRMPVTKGKTLVDEYVIRGGTFDAPTLTEDDLLVTEAMKIAETLANDPGAYRIYEPSMAHGHKHWFVGVISASNGGYSFGIDVEDEGSYLWVDPLRFEPTP